MSVRSDRRYRFPASRRELWDALTEVDRYRTWWPWLRSFDGHVFAAGESWRCTVKPQLPYTLEFVIALDEVKAAESARARLTGDLDGWAELSLHDDGHGSQLRLRSDLTARSGPDHVLILPWNLTREIVAQLPVAAWGGRFVTAIPRIRRFSHAD